MDNQKAKLLESFKEALRYVVLFVASSLIITLDNNTLGVSQWITELLYVLSCMSIGCFTIPVATVTGFLTLVLRGADKYLYYLGKEKHTLALNELKKGDEEPTVKWRGLVGF